MESKVLIVDDDKEIRDSIQIYLRTSGIEGIKAKDGIEALEILEETDISIVLLDIMMPKLDGIKTCLKVRERKNIPIIILSAKSEDTDKILGLNSGADDYITKPFNPMELVARVKSQLRRYFYLGDGIESVNKIKIDGLSIDKDAKIVTVDGEEIKFTPIEYKILLLLSENAGRVLSIEQIYENVWEEPFYKSENTVAVHIRRIREKIEINPKDPKYIKVVWGIGYKMEKHVK